MVFVKGGEFEMGVNEGSENPAHQVYVDDFYIAKYEVTVEQWRRFTQEADIPFPWNSFEFVSMVGRNVDFELPEDWPIYYVTWFEAVWFCNWLSEQNGLEPVYVFNTKAFRIYIYQHGDIRPQIMWDRTANGFRLPTEAEWEYAATNQGRCRECSSTELDDVAWTRENSNDEVHPVGSKRPSELGVYDLLGNVGEWCWDYFDIEYYSISPKNNPSGPTKGYDPMYFGESFSNIRSNRGCSWKTTRKYCTPTFRFRSPALQRGTIGIRLVRNAREK
jgi:sulfatase modifying factor 1